MTEQFKTKQQEKIYSMIDKVNTEILAGISIAIMVGGGTVIVGINAVLHWVCSPALQYLAICK